MRIAVCAEGANLDVPVGWAHYEWINDELIQTRFVPNPEYVPGPDPTERESVEAEIYDLECRLESKRQYLASLEPDAAA